MTIAQAIKSTLVAYPEGHRLHLRKLGTLIDSLRFGMRLKYGAIQSIFEAVVGWDAPTFEDKMQELEAWEARS